jgi:hypothetical protein
LDSRISKILREYCRGVKLVNLKSQGEGGKMEAFYQFAIRRRYKSTQLVSELSGLSDQIKFNLYFDQDEANIAV